MVALNASHEGVFNNSVIKNVASSIDAAFLSQTWHTDKTQTATSIRGD